MNETNKQMICVGCNTKMPNNNGNGDHYICGDCSTKLLETNIILENIKQYNPFPKGVDRAKSINKNLIEMYSLHQDGIPC